MTVSEQTTKYELGSTDLFKPIKIGNITLDNRIFYPPTTRQRATIDGVPTKYMYDYYNARSKDNGGLIMVEGTFISKGASGEFKAPGIYTDQQAQAWKKIVSAIHNNGSKAAVQLWNLGRAAHPDELKRLGQPLVGPSAVYYSEESQKAAAAEGLELHALTIEEIEEYKQAYVHAAKNAIQVAGFDLIELHDAHGYFLDQFLLPVSNKRTDKYGGSIENRARLALEIIDLLINEIGAERIGIRLSPWATFQGMLAEKEEVHPIVQLGYLLSELNKREIAFVSIVEPRVSGNLSTDKSTWGGKSNEWVYQIFTKGVILRAGAYLHDREKGFQAIKTDISNGRTLLGFSRYFTSNPDLIHRLKNGLDLTEYDRSRFYTLGNYGYNTWTSYGEEDLPEDHPVSLEGEEALA